jgi:protein-arginine kinase activator protein McsA
MTNDDIEKIAQRVADLLYKKANEHLRFEIAEEDQEQMLLAELAKAMTLLDSYLIKEEYDKCAILQNKIKRIENKLKNL